VKDIIGFIVIKEEKNLKVYSGV